MFEIKLNCVSFAQHLRMFLVGKFIAFPQPERQCQIAQRLEIPLFAAPTKVALLFIGKAFCCLPSHPKLVYSM